MIGVFVRKKPGFKRTADKNRMIMDNIMQSETGKMTRKNKENKYFIFLLHCSLYKGARNYSAFNFMIKIPLQKWK